MSYRCLKCEGVIYDRKVTLCPHCGGDLPPDSLFVSSGMTASDPEIEGVEVPVALLARAWAEMSKVRSDARGSRRAAARYFSDGIASGLPSQLLIKWLFFWPNERESAFGQAGFSARAGRDFVKMVKELTVREALASDDERPAATSAIAKDSNITAENICAEARAQIMWGEPAPVVRDLLSLKGCSGERSGCQSPGIQRSKERGNQKDRHPKYSCRAGNPLRRWRSSVSMLQILRLPDPYKQAHLLHSLHGNGNLWHVELVARGRLAPSPTG